MLKNIGPNKEDSRNHRDISPRFSNSYSGSAMAGCVTNLTR